MKYMTEKQYLMAGISEQEQAEEAKEATKSNEAFETYN